MSVDNITTRARLAVDVARHAHRSAVRQFLQSRLVRWRYGGPPVDQLLLVPQDLRTADPSFATEIYHGHFGLAGAIALTGSESPFFIQPPTPEWHQELHGFGWLRHLRAAGDEISREHARALVRDWISAYHAMGGIPWRAEIVARRIISWLSHAGIVLEGAEPRFYEAVLHSLTRQVRYLRATYRDAPPGVPRLTALTALLLAGLCAPDEVGAEEASVKPFCDELELQIMVDGGHVSRSPIALIELLLDLLPLRQCFIARDKVPPQALTAAIDRMMPMIRFFRLGDGSLARFNGTGATPTDLLANVLAYDDVQGKPVSQATQSGYFRLHRGQTLIIAEMGAPPPGAISRAAHAGCLSFEMSSGRHVVITNCGAPGPGSRDWRLVARATAAHSTVTVCDTSSSQFECVGLLGETAAEARLKGPAHVAAHASREEEGVILEGSHDGYESRFGITHTRRIGLTADGVRVLGEDLLRAPGGLRGQAEANQGAFAVRFHLHPAIRAQLAGDHRSATLILPDNREVWRLASPSLPLAIEDSVFLADNRGRRRTLQAVIHGHFGGAIEVRVDWRLERVGIEQDLAGGAASGESDLGEGAPPA